MALGDPQYQINDLKSQLKDIQNQLRASNPGNRPSLGPDHPLRVVTSTGQSGAGSDSDNFSRAVNTGIEAGLAAVESVQDVLVTPAPIVFLFGTGVTQTIRSTNYLRPDPIQGDTYRILASGYLQNSDVAATNFQFKIQIGGSSLIQLSQFTVAAASFQVWWLHLTFTVMAAGAVGTFNISSRLGASLDQPGLPLSGAIVGQDFILTRGTIPANFVSTVITLTVTNLTGASNNFGVALYSYSLERMGAGFASKV